MRGLAEAGAARRPAGDADADLEVRSRRHANPAATDLRDQLAGVHVLTDVDIDATGVAVVDVAAAERAVAHADHRRGRAEAGDPGLDDGAATARAQLPRRAARLTLGEHVDALVERPAARTLHLARVEEREAESVASRGRLRSHDHGLDHER